VHALGLFLRELGFGRVLTKGELDIVNAARRMIGKNTNIDEQAANKWLGTVYKFALKESPQVKHSNINASNEGYWNSFHMSVQFKDVVEFKFVLPQADLISIFLQLN